MKILFICEGVSDSSIRAQPWKHVIETASRLRQLGLDLVLVSDKFNGAQKDEDLLGVPVHRIRRKGLLFDTSELCKFLNQEDADIVNWHCSDVWSSVYFWRLRKMLDVKIVWTMHSGILSLDDLRNLHASDYVSIYKFWNNFLSASVPKLLIKKWTSVPQLTHVITLSRRTAEKLTHYGVGSQNITAIPSGVDTELFKPSDIGTEEEPILLYFGPLSTFRGIDLLLSSFKTISAAFPLAKLLLLARESSEGHAWIKKAEHMRNIDVISHALGQSELVKLINRASLVILPFRFWPQVECPLTILEAMSMQKTVVTTNVGAIPEIIKNWENGIMVSPTDSKQLARVVSELIESHSLLDKMGMKARTHVERFHDWNKIVNDTLSILRAHA